MSETGLGVKPTQMWAFSPHFGHSATDTTMLAELVDTQRPHRLYP